LGVAERIKQQLAGLRKDTLTIGLAEHPCLDYKKTQIFENAYKALEHARFLGPDSLIAMDALSLNVSGDQCFDKGDIPGAIEEFKRGLQLDPAHANLHNSLGVCYGVLKQYGNACAAFETALARDPKDVMVLYNLGLAHLLMNERRLAMQYFKQAGRLDAGMYEPAYQMGRIYLDSGRFDLARQHLERASRLNAGTAAIFTGLGECYLALKDTRRAVKAFKKAIQLNGNEAGALSELGWLYHQMGKNAEIAELFCRQSVSIAPENGLYQFRLGKLLTSRGLYEEARQALENASDLGYDDPRQLAGVGPETEADRDDPLNAVAKRSAL
jgi:tetratricopeptide (TPR) repeat protein